MRNKKKNPGADVAARGARKTSPGGGCRANTKTDGAGKQAVVIGSLRKNRREIVRVALETYMGIDLIDLRIFFQARDGAYLVTTKGVAIKRCLLPELIRLLQLAAARVSHGDGLPAKYNGGA